MQNLQHLREDYRAKKLSLKKTAEHPIVQFKQWMEEALQSEIKEPNAMILATATKDGKPSARTVLLKGLDKKGFVFYTNYRSHKGQELAENPQASLVFLWLDLERQVRIEGKVEKLSPKKSTKYFQSRPKGSQIGAWASPQSDVIDSRKVLTKNVNMLEKFFEKDEVLPRPEHWGGYVLRPDTVEFWQGRSSRLHDRIFYFLNKKNKWKRERLAP